MRNLKKVLSLALAMVMLLGMMVIGAGAATKYADDEKIVNKEAVTVVSAIGVLQGVGENTFNPTGTLTRAEAAVVIAKLDLGAEAAAALTPTNASTFNDVGTGYGWAKAYIDYCAGRGYIVGDDNGNFLPAKTVSSVEFSAMVLRMLGYRSENEGLVGDKWIINTSALARKSGLTTDVVLNDKEGMTRDDMAQMVFNSLTAPMVEYEGMDITIGDVSFNAKAKVRTHTGSSLVGSVSNSTYNNGRIDANITPIRLCEEKFPNLKLDTTAVDGFGHTASVWKYRGAEIKGSTVPVDADYATNTEVLKDTPDWAKIDDMYIIPRSSGNADYTKIYVNGFYGVPGDSFNGVTYGSATGVVKLSKAGITSNGRLVEVYLNENDMTRIDKIVVTDTALATVYKVNSDGTIKVKLEKTNLEAKSKSSEEGFFVQGNVVLNTSEEDTAVYENPQVGEVVLVKGFNPSDTTPVIGRPTAKGAQQTTLVSVDKAEELNAFVSKKTYSAQLKASFLTVRGDDHDYVDAFNVVADYTVDDFEPNNKNYDSKLYLDEYDNIMKAVMGVDPNATTDNLIAVAEYYESLLDGKITGMVRGVISNGETVNYPLKNRGNVAEGIYTYELANGRYTLKPVTARVVSDITENDKSTHVANTGMNETIHFKSSDVLGKKNAGSCLLSDDVKFIFVKNGEISVAKGRQTYDYEKATVLAQALRKNKNDNNYQVRAVFILAEPDIADISDLIFVHSEYRNNTVIKDLDDGTQVKQYGYNAYDSDGKKIEDFLGFNDKLADVSGRFYKKDLDKYGAQKDTTGNVVKKHTLLPGNNDPANSIAVTSDALWVTQANGQTGDAFTVSDGKKDGTTLRFISNNTKVIDLSGCGREISNVAELNDAIFDGYGDTQVAVIFNASGDNNDVLIAKTVFVTMCKKGAAHETGTPGDGTIVPPADEGKLTIKDADKGLVSSSLKDGDEIKKGKEFTVTVKAGYEAKATGADRKEGETGNTYTFTATEDKVTVTISKKTTLDTFTLTLNVLTNSEAKVYLDGVVKAADKTVATETGNAKTWNIKENTKVMIEDDSTFTVAGTILLDGVDATVNGTTNRASFTMSKNMTVTLGAPATDVMYAVTFKDGIELVKFLKSDGTTEVKPADQKGDTYYVKASDQVCLIQVKLNGQDTAIASGSETFTSAYWNAVKTTKWYNGGDNDTIDLDAALSGNIYVHAAVRVDFDVTSATGVMFLGQPVSGSWETFLVAPNAEYAIGGDNDDLAGLIVTALGATDPKTAKTAIGGTLKVEKTAMKLWGAYKLHLTGVESVKVDSTNEVVKDGEYVVKGTTINATADGVNLICVNSENFASSITNITVNSGNVDRIAKATKITLKQNSGVKLQTKAANGNFVDFKAADSSADVYVYVMVGAEITATSTNTKNLAFTRTTASEGSIPEGGKLSETFNVGNVDITIDVTP